MPIYVYECPKCHRVVELQRRISEMDDRIGCPNLCTEIIATARDPVKGERIPVTMTRKLTAPSRPIIK